MRSGSVACTRWLSDGKYSWAGRPFTVTWPEPGRMRTRATERLRRPVAWTRGWGIAVFLASVSRAGLGVGQVERLGALGPVRMGRPGVDLELGGHLPAQAVLGQHADDALAHGLGRIALEPVGVGAGLEAAGVAGVAVDDLALGLAGGEDDLGGVHHDDVVAGVEVGGEGRLVLAAQEAGHLGRHTAEDEAVGVDEVPGASDLAGLGGVRGHGRRTISVQWPRWTRWRSPSRWCSWLNWATRPSWWRCP